MQVTTVHYERKISDDNYGNFGLGMTAQVDEDDDPKKTAEALRDLVNATLAGRREAAEEEVRIAREASRLRHEIASLEADLGQSKHRWEKAREFLRIHGVEDNQSFDPPF
jgi:predicted Zn-dependent peptidase